MSDYVPTDKQLNPGTFWELNKKTGNLEEIDMLTGAVLRIAGSLDKIPTAEFVETEIEGTKYLVQSGTKNLKLPANRHPYSEALADVICAKIMEGSSWSEIHKLPGMPNRYTLMYWRKNNLEFEAKVKAALSLRAESLRDQAVEIGVDSMHVDKDAVAGRRHATEVLFKAAEVDSPERYGKRVEVTGSVVHQIILNTGIRRPEDSAITVDAKTVSVELIESKTDKKVDED